MLKYIFVAAIVACVSATTYKDCGSVDGAIVSVDVIPCPTEPCALKRGTNVTMDVVFTSHVASRAATTEVYGIIAGVSIKFPSVPVDACSNKNMPCPVTSGQQITYRNYVYVNTIYPKVQALVQWEIHDDQNKKLVCFVVPTYITD